MISIVIPVFNASDTLKKCLESVIAQSLLDYECLLIDDGSTDDSGQICDEYAMRDHRFRVFHKENGGVSSARNVGLDNMKGEFVTFIDSDDWVFPNYLKDLYEGMLGCDIAIAYSTIYFSDGSFKREEYPAQKVTVSNFDVLFLQNDMNWHTSPWGKLFKADIIEKNHFRFKQDVHIGEDAIFLYNYLSIADSISVINSTEYCYQAESYGSLTKRINTVESEWTGMSLLHEAVDELIQKKNLSKDAIKPLSWLKASYIRRVLTSLYYNPINRKRRLEVIMKLDLDLYSNFIYESSWQGKIQVNLLKHRCFLIYDLIRLSVVSIKRGKSFLVMCKK